MERKNKKIIICILLLFVFITFVFLFLFIFNNKKEPVVMERKITTYIYRSNSSVLLDRGGYVIVGSNNHNTYGLEKAKFSMYDDSNNKVIEKVYNKGYNSSFNSVIKEDNTFIAVGSYESTKNEYSSGTRTALIVKYDVNGEIIKDNDFQVISNSYFKSIISVEDGYIVCGSSYNDTSLYSGAVLIKYDKDLNEIWRKYTGNNGAIYNDLVFANNVLYLVGVDNNIGILSIYDLDGNLISNHYYPSLNDNGFSSIITYNDSLYVSTTKYIDGYTYGLIINYGFDGSLLKEVRYEKLSNVSFNKLLLDSNNNIIVVGNIETFNDGEFFTDGIIGKYSIDLLEQSVVKYSTNRNVSFNDIKSINDKYIVVGDSRKSDYDISSKIFMFSSSLKSLGV